MTPSDPRDAIIAEQDELIAQLTADVAEARSHIPGAAGMTPEEAVGFRRCYELLIHELAILNDMSVLQARSFARIAHPIVTAEYEVAYRIATAAHRGNYNANATD
jgi:hypothetical protein